MVYILLSVWLVAFHSERWRSSSTLNFLCFHTGKVLVGGVVSAVILDFFLSSLWVLIDLLSLFSVRWRSGEDRFFLFNEDIDGAMAGRGLFRGFLEVVLGSECFDPTDLVVERKNQWVFGLSGGESSCFWVIESLRCDRRRTEWVIFVRSFKTSCVFRIVLRGGILGFFHFFLSTSLVVFKQASPNITIKDPYIVLSFRFFMNIFNFDIWIRPILVKLIFISQISLRSFVKLLFSFQRIISSLIFLLASRILPWHFIRRQPQHIRRPLDALVKYWLVRSWRRDRLDTWPVVHLPFLP